MGTSSSTVGSTARVAITEEQWRRMMKAWAAVFTHEDFKPKSIIQFLCKDSMSMRYGEVDRLVGSNAFVQIADGVFIVLKKTNAIWSFVPDKYLEKAQTIIKASWSVAQIAKLTSVEGVKLIVTMSAAEGLFGAASVTSGLATLGGGSVAAGGLGMAGGIMVVAAAPSLLTAHTIYQLCDAFENNSTTPAAVALGGVTGAIGGSTVGIIMVAESGSVVGLSASGITSGLAALGGGSVASGGLGMLGGVAAVAGVASLGALAVGGVVWAVAHELMQSTLHQQRIKMLDLACENGFENLLE